MPTDPPTPLTDHDLDYGHTLRGLRSGLKVFGRYQLIRKLGQGGMGVVWLAQDTKLDLEMALKFLPESLVHDEVALADLRRETRRCMRLTHQHIVHVFDLVDDADTAAIAMEFVDGKSFSALRLEQPQGVFEVAHLAPLIRQVCDGLTYAHEQGRVVHYDLKPGNLMVTSGGLVKVMDFGIAASINDSNSRQSRAPSTAGMGTRHYMSPQQHMGFPPSVSDDMYSLGATIYELLSGKPPFHGFRDRALELQIETGVPPSMTERRKELLLEETKVIPASWEDTIASCLEKEAVKRPQNIHILWENISKPATPQIIEFKAEQKPKGPDLFQPEIHPPKERDILKIHPAKRYRLRWLTGLALASVGAAFFGTQNQSGYVREPGQFDFLGLVIEPVDRFGFVSLGALASIISLAIICVIASKYTSSVGRSSKFAAGSLAAGMWIAPICFAWWLLIAIPISTIAVLLLYVGHHMFSLRLSDCDAFHAAIIAPVNTCLCGTLAAVVFGFHVSKGGDFASFATKHPFLAGPCTLLVQIWRRIAGSRS